MKTTTSVSINFGIFHVITLIFIALKLLGAITWGWFFVLCPSLFVLAVVAILFILAVILT